MGFCVLLKGRNLFKSFWLDNTVSSDRNAATPEVVSAIKLDVVFKVAGLATILREMYERNIRDNRDIFHAAVHPANNKLYKDEIVNFILNFSHFPQI